MSINTKKKDIIVEDIKSKCEDYIYYYDEETAGWTGMGPACACCGWKSAIRLTQDELEQYNEWNLTGVNVLRWGDGIHTGIIEVFGEGTPSQPGPIITSAPYYFDEFDWFRVNLNESVPIKEHNEIWIAVEWCTKEPNTYPPAVDNMFPVIGKSDWVYLNDYWSELYLYGFYFSWCMEAIVQKDGINQPPNAPTIDGPTNGKVGKFYDYNFTDCIDLDGDDMTYHVEWDDGGVDDGFVESGGGFTLTHSWDTMGAFTIKAKLIDVCGAESELIEYDVTITRKNRAININSMFYGLLEQFPILQRLLSLLRV